MLFGSSEKNTGQKEQEKTKKLPYEAPVLIVYGKVSELTAAGSGSRVERGRGRGRGRRRRRA